MLLPQLFMVASVLSVIASARTSVYPACETADLHGHVNKTVVGDFTADACAVFVSHKHKAVYLTPAVFPKVMRLVTKAFCEGYQCHPDELARHKGVRGSVMSEYFVFTFVKNPWMRAQNAHASCALGLVDYVGRVEHAVADWNDMLNVKNGLRRPDIPA